MPAVHNIHIVFRRIGDLQKVAFISEQRAILCNLVVNIFWQSLALMLLASRSRVKPETVQPD